MVHALLRMQHHAPQFIAWQQAGASEASDDLICTIAPQPATVVGGIARFQLHLEIQDGLHLAAGGTDQNGATMLSLVMPKEAELQIDWPTGEPIESAITDMPALVYAGQVTIPIQLRVNNHMPKQIGLQLDYQPCSDRACQRPQSRRITVRLNTP